MQSLTNKSNVPINFQDVCHLYGIRHYGDKKTYSNINSIWKLIHKNIQKKQLVFLNFTSLINYLNAEHDAALPKFKFIHWYIINEFYKYQTNINLYVENLTKYNKRLIGYAKSRNCLNVQNLKARLNESIKRIKIDETNFDIESKRDFLITALYICDYLEDFPKDIPKELFNL
jgi:hypothetical protein